MGGARKKSETGLDALEVLAREHQAILLHLDALQQSLAGLQKEERGVAPEALNEVEAGVRFLETELRIHLRKEEEVLVPALAARLGLRREGRPIGMMLLEHDECREILRALSREVRILQMDGQSGSPVDVIQVGYALIRLRREHIEKEDNFLFPIARANLDPDRLLALGATMGTKASDSDGPPA
jgi:hemerythrin-like domain-containing protein